MRRHTRIVACLVTLTVSYAAADELTPVDPASIGLNPEKLAEIDTTMQEYVRQGKIVGCLGLVARGGKVGYLQMWGPRIKRPTSRSRPTPSFASIR